MRPGVGHRLERGRHGRGQRAEDEDPERHDQEGDHGEFDLARLDLLAEVFGRAPHHQPGEEDREHDVDEHPVEPGPDAAEDHLARLHVQEQHEPRKRHETVVHGVDRAVRGGGGRRGPERRERDAEALLLALHVAGGLVDPSSEQRVARLLEGVDDREPGHEQHRHRREDRDALAHVADEAAVEEREGDRDQQDRDRTAACSTGPSGSPADAPS